MDDPDIAIIVITAIILIITLAAAIYFIRRVVYAAKRISVDGSLLDIALQSLAQNHRLLSGKVMAGGSEHDVDIFADAYGSYAPMIDTGVINDAYSMFQAEAGDLSAPLSESATDKIKNDMIRSGRYSQEQVALAVRAVNTSLGYTSHLSFKAGDMHQTLINAACYQYDKVTKRKPGEAYHVVFRAVLMSNIQGDIGSLRAITCYNNECRDTSDINVKATNLFTAMGPGCLYIDIIIGGTVRVTLPTQLKNE